MMMEAFKLVGGSASRVSCVTDKGGSDRVPDILMKSVVARVDVAPLLAYDSIFSFLGLYDTPLSHAIFRLILTLFIS
jgi:hypothetical protein